MLQLARQWQEVHGRLSAPYLQRKLKISYEKAVQIITLITKELMKE